MTSALPLADSIANPFSGLDIPVARILTCLILADLPQRAGGERLTPTAATGRETLKCDCGRTR
jgi:hypothetical protein